jgi:hypothetical protein
MWPLSRRLWTLVQEEWVVFTFDISTKVTEVICAVVRSWSFGTKGAESEVRQRFSCDSFLKGGYRLGRVAQDYNPSYL